MFSGEMHIFIKSLDTYNVSLCIVCELYFVSATDALGSPVEISHIYRASDSLGYGVEACLPSLYGLACAFRCKSEVDYRSPLHLIDDAESDVAASLTVYRNST